MPANGTRFKEMETVFACRTTSSGDAEGSDGIESQTSTSLVISNREKNDAGDGCGARCLQTSTEACYFLVHFRPPTNRFCLIAGDAQNEPATGLATATKPCPLTRRAVTAMALATRSESPSSPRPAL